MKFIDDKASYLNYIYRNCGCVNAGQSPEERRIKYKLAKNMGATRKWAITLRDWRLNNFAKHFGYSSWESMIKFLKGEDID